MELALYIHIWACYGVYVLIFMRLRYREMKFLLNSQCILSCCSEYVL